MVPPELITSSLILFYPNLETNENEKNIWSDKREYRAGARLLYGATHNLFT